MSMLAHIISLHCEELLLLLFFPPKVLSTSEVQQISDPLGCDGFSVPHFTSNLKCLSACLSLVFTQGCFFSPGDPRQTVTLKTNKTASAMLIFFEGSWGNGTNILSWQTGASEVIDRPAGDAIIYQWSRMSALLYLSALSLDCLLPCLFERRHFMEVNSERKYFCLAISRSMEMCLPASGHNGHSI